MPEPDVVRLSHRLANDPERLGRDLAVRMDVIGCVEIDRIDLIPVHEAFEIDDLRRLDLQVLQLFVGDRDIAPALVLVPLDDLIAVDRIAGFGIDELLRHAVAGLGIELVEPDAFGFGCRRNQIDRAGHQRQAQKTVPACARHVDLLFRRIDRATFNKSIAQIVPGRYGGDQTAIRRRTAAPIDWRSLPISAQGSVSRAARRWGTVATVKPSGRTPCSTSSQNSGVDTGAPGRARGEYAPIAVAPRLLRR